MPIDLTPIICVLTLVGLAVAPPVLAAADHGDDAGIAARYPGDVGIGEDPAVILAEDFEDDGLRKRGWYDINGEGKRILVSDDDHITGERSLKLIYPEGHTGPWMRAPHFAQGHDTVHVRYYRKWADGWEWGGPGDGNGHDTRLIANGPDVPKQAYKDSDAWVLMMESCTHLGKWQRGHFGLMLFAKSDFYSEAAKQVQQTLRPQGHQPKGREWWLATVDQSRAPRSESGRWYCVEYAATMNTPGQADGRVQGWIDGVQVYDVRDCLIRDADQSELQWRRWWLGPYFHGGTTREQASYLDSLVIATSYIGPIVEAE